MHNPSFIIGVCAILVGLGGMLMGIKMVRAKGRPSLRRITPTGRPATAMGVVLICCGALVIVGYFLIGYDLVKNRTEDANSGKYRKIEIPN